MVILLVVYNLRKYFFILMKEVEDEKTNRHIFLRNTYIISRFSFNSACICSIWVTTKKI